MRTAPALVLALAAVLSLGACVSDAPVVLPEESHSYEPIFASDEEALAAAEEAFTAFLSVADTIRQEGGEQPERLENVAMGELLRSEVDSFTQFSERGHRTTGQTRFDTVSLQQYDAHVDESTVFIYLCEDFGETDILDSSGASVIGPNRQIRWPLVVGFDAVNGSLRVSSIDDWTGDDFCAPSS